MKIEAKLQTYNLKSTSEFLPVKMNLLSTILVCEEVHQQTSCQKAVIPSKFRSYQRN